MHYFFIKMKRDYIIQLFLAIMWDKYFDKCTPAEKADIQQTIFGKKPALGDFVAAAQICAKYCPDKKEREKLNNFFNETRSKVIFNRNQEDHKNLKENTEMETLINEWIKDTEKNFHYFSTDLSEEGNGYKYSFLIPQNEEDLSCARIDEFGVVDQIYGVREDFKGSTVGKKMLYYRIESPEGEKETYRLSPFIHYFGREVDGIFTIYSCCVGRTHSLETEARSIFDDQINDSSDRNILESRICRHMFEMKNFLQPCDDKLFYISSFCNTKINKSSYAQLKLAVDNSYKYNESVVHAECKKVYTFCKNPYEQIYVIAGPGGLGKTALLLNVVQKVMGANLSGVKPDKIIFLSAKKQYLTLTEDKKSLQLSMEKCDISDLDSLKYKLALYLSEEELDENIDLDKFIENTLKEQNRSVLLMLDDLDTLGRETHDEITSFLSKFSAQKIKTIITTRNVDKVGNNGLILERLNEEKCAEFVRWYVKSYIPNMEEQFEINLTSEQYRKALAEVSRGIPIFIEKWIEMSRYGEQYLEIGKRKVFTRRDCIRYLYNTTLTNLDKVSMQLIYIMKEIVRYSGQREFDKMFLYFISSVETVSELEISLKKLMDMCLVMSKGNDHYELFDFDYEWIQLYDFGYYHTPIYEAILSKTSQVRTDNANPGTLQIFIDSLKENSLSDKAANLLLDKFCSMEGKRNCSYMQVEEVEALRKAKDSEGSQEQMSAVMMGDWNPDKFSFSEIKSVFQKMESVQENQEAKIKTFEMIVNCCVERMESILEDDEDPDEYVGIMRDLWVLVRGFMSQEESEKLRELKAIFKESFDETF